MGRGCTEAVPGLYGGCTGEGCVPGGGPARVPEGCRSYQTTWTGVPTGTCSNSSSESAMYIRMHPCDA